MYIMSFNLWQIKIDLAREAQITLLVAKKITILAKYSDFANAFYKLLKLILKPIWLIILSTSLSFQSILLFFLSTSSTAAFAYI